MGPILKRAPPWKPLPYPWWPKDYDFTRQMAEPSLWPLPLWVRDDKVNFSLKHLSHIPQYPGPYEPSWVWQGLALETFEAALMLYISLKTERTAFWCFAGWWCKVCCNYPCNLVSLKILHCVLTITTPKQGYAFTWSALKATCPGIAYFKRWFKSGQLLVGLSHLSCDTFKSCLSYLAQKKINRIWMFS